jgi:tRNA pseudouridine38-40 synthase
MRNLKLTIEYDGTNYCGWQVQKISKKKSIQETIEKSLQKILQEKSRLIAQGRTDAGVHAEAQVANFKTKSNISIEKIQKALNGLLPQDIKIIRIEEKPLSFHSRFDARYKVYRYTILNRPYPSAFLRNTAYFYPYPLNIKLIQKEARCLLGRHNFKALQGSGEREKHTVRTIKRIYLVKDRDLIYTYIMANGFLKNMARNIVGTLIEIGRERLGPGSLKKILLSQNRKLAGPTAPAKGLCLVKVVY